MIQMPWINDVHRWKKSCPPIWSYFSSLISEILQFNPTNLEKNTKSHFEFEKAEHHQHPIFFGREEYLYKFHSTSPINLFKRKWSLWIPIPGAIRCPGNHWNPRPQIESILWRSDCTSPGSPIWESLGKFGKRMEMDLEVKCWDCKHKNLYQAVKQNYVYIYIYISIYINGNL